MPVSDTMRHPLSCTTKSIRTDARMPKAKAAPMVAVNVAVWVMNPGPMADVAIRKMAATSDERRAFTKSPDGAGMCCASLMKLSRKDGMARISMQKPCQR